MYTKRLVCKDTYYVGGSDRRLALFENVYPLTNGASYNSYLIVDKKTCLLDSVDKSVDEEFYTKVNEVLDGKPLDYLIVNHMEPDHSYSLKFILMTHPECTLVTSEKALVMFKNFNDGFCPKNVKVVKEFDVLDLGEHKLTFVFTPMVHWPEVMMTYDTTTKTLFSADAFGTFGALSGNLFADRVSFEKNYEVEARRYYTNIVGKYGTQVLAALKKASTVQIENICPLHGPIWRQDLSYLLSLYTKWASYEPEVNGVLIVYGSVYGHSEVAANLIADELSDKGLNDIALYDASKTDKSYLVAEAFKYSHIVICASTYNMGIFTPVEEFLLDLKYHNLQNRKFAVVENGSWAPNSGKLVCEILGGLKGFTQIGSTVTFKSSVKEDSAAQIKALADMIYDTVPTKRIDNNPLTRISYGLFALSTEMDGKQNACIINTVNMVANNPDLIMIAVNKANYSAETILKTKKCNISILTKHTSFDLFKRFGFQSGRTINKFEGFNDYKIAENRINYLTKFANAYLSLEVKDVLDLGSHYGFILYIKSSTLLNNEESVTYDYYQKNIKPIPPKETKKKGWICKICGYVYEGEVLPKDFICPICKHGVADFEKLGE